MGVKQVLRRTSKAFVTRQAGNQGRGEKPHLFSKSNFIIRFSITQSLQVVESLSQTTGLTLETIFLLSSKMPH